MNSSQPTENRQLTGKTAWVTGAARGIGAATAKALAGAGAKVHLSDLLDCQPIVEDIEARGGHAWAHTLDVTDAAACHALVERLTAEGHPIDLLVANAGICPAGKVTGQDEQWKQVMSVNVDGTRHCVDACWPVMEAAGGGAMVLVSSMAYYQGGVIVGTEYSTSKAAIIGMTRHLARNGGPLGIRCNAVAPGIIETPMTESFPAPDLERIPLRRLGSAQDVAEPILFLCSPGASYMTGTVLNVTGGMILAA